MLYDARGIWTSSTYSVPFIYFVVGQPVIMQPKCEYSLDPFHSSNGYVRLLVIFREIQDWLQTPLN